MTSKTSPHTCYVYITLPGETEAVTAGRYELTADRHGTPVGRFVFGKSYRERSDAVDIDPLELRLGRGTFETANLKGIFGALRDAGPDYWGRRLIERHVGGQLGELDYLLNSPDDRAGALGFGHGVMPPAPMRMFNQTLALEKLQALADAVISDEDAPDATLGQVQDLMLLGTSMGGARPKAVVEDGDGLWLAKFNRPDDAWNTARVEHAMLVMARRCGIATAESRIATIGQRDVLLVKRFDREKAPDGGYHRSRMVSGLTLLRAEDTHQSREKWSYIALVEELRRVSSAPKKDAGELFRRMCFNALISNTDDHPRNHAIVAHDRAWKLSPAYDLTPKNWISLDRRDLAMACGDAGRYANAANLRSQGQRFLLPAAEAEVIVNDMATTIGSAWHDIARSEGVSAADCEQIKGAFVYPGFWQSEE